MSGPGGEVPAVFVRPPIDPRVLCRQGVAPERHQRCCVTSWDFGVPGTGLPATVRRLGRWLTLLRDHGTSPCRCSAALGYAEAASPLAPQVARRWPVRPLPRYWPSSAATGYPRPRARVSHRLPFSPRPGAAARAAVGPPGSADRRGAGLMPRFVAAEIRRFVATPVRASGPTTPGCSPPTTSRSGRRLRGRGGGRGRRDGRWRSPPVVAGPVLA
jgi:hypothetical protein